MKLRDLWRDHIGADDYERHMAAVGQAEANGGLLYTAPPSPTSTTHIWNVFRCASKASTSQPRWIAPS